MRHHLHRLGKLCSQSRQPCTTFNEVPKNQSRYRSQPVSSETSAQRSHNWPCRQRRHHWIFTQVLSSSTIKKRPGRPRFQPVGELNPSHPPLYHNTHVS